MFGLCVASLGTFAWVRPTDQRRDWSARHGGSPCGATRDGIKALPARQPFDLHFSLLNATVAGDANLPGPLLRLRFGGKELFGILHAALSGGRIAFRRRYRYDLSALTRSIKRNHCRSKGIRISIRTIYRGDKETMAAIFTPTANLGWKLTLLALAAVFLGAMGWWWLWPRMDYVRHVRVDDPPAGSIQPPTPRRRTRHRLSILPHVGRGFIECRSTADLYLHDLPFADLDQCRAARAGARKPGQPQADRLGIE